MARDVTLIGRLLWSDLEGGTYLLRTEDGDQYDLHGATAWLPPESRQPGEPGLLVRVRGILHEDVADIHMVGPVVQVEALELIEG